MRRTLVGLVSILVVSVASADKAPTFESLCADIGIDAKAQQALREGKSYDRFPQEVSDRDIAAGVSFITKSSPHDVAALFTQFADVAVNPTVRASHEITSAADFATLSLGAKGADEAKRFVAAKPGEQLNLSTAEIARFDALGPAATQAQVEDVLRAMLVERWQAYRDRGLAGITPYERGKTELHGDDEIRRVVRSMPEKIKSYAPRLAAALDAYPKRDGAVKESFRWIVYEQDKRPTVTLRHRMTLTLDDGNVVLSDREIYVSQGYNTMQAFAGIFAIASGPTATGTMVLYRANTSTDRVEGSASGMKHSIGRKMMAKQLDAIFARLRTKLQ